MCNGNRTAAVALCVVILTLAIGAFIAVPAAAQSITGTILGNVTDGDGLALPGATVTATNTETGATRTVVTDGEGAYLISALQIGLYRVDVSMSGFRSFQQEQFSLSSAQNARVDARLAVGGVTEQVDVVANAIRVDTRSSAVVTNVDRQRMDELPMLNRSVLTMAVLAPGITEVDVPDAVTNQRSAPNITSAAMGGRTNQNDTQLDGATLNVSIHNRPSNLPSPDSIQEFQVLTNAYSAEFGRGGGASMVAITKSGTNSFRGGVWEYHRNDRLNGMNYFAVTKPYMRRNQFGTNLGGPIATDKTFFFVNYEGLRFDRQQEQLFTPPTPAMRAGDFSLDRFGNPQTTIIYDPLTQQPFPGNKIPADRMDPMALRLLEYVNLPNQPNGVWARNADIPTRGDQVSVKIDHKLSQSNTASVRFYRDYTKVDEISQVPIFTSYIGNEVRSWSITNMHVFGNGMVGEGRLSLSKVETLSDLAPAAKIDAKELGFNVEKTELHYVPQHPHFAVTGAGGAFQINAPEAPRWDRSLMNGGNYRLSWVTGRHNMKVGYEYLYRHWRTLRQHGGTAGNFGHNGQSTRRLSDGAGGLGMADFLLGRPSSYSQSTAFDKNDYSPLHTIFLQDDLRLNRLTLNLGLRYEIEVPWKIVENRGATFVRGQKSERYPQAPEGLVFLGDPGVGDTMVPIQQRVLPRVGFALDVLGNGRTAVRGGYGKFGYTQGAIVPSQNNELPPFHPIVNLNDPYSLTDPWGPNRTSPFPYQRNNEGEGLFPTTPIPMQVLDTRWRSGYTHQFNVTFQQQLGDQVVVSAGYVGSRARNMSRRESHNLAVFIPGASTAANIDSRRPLRAFGSVVTHISDPGSWTDYNSLQVTAMKQYANNYTLQMTYTLGRSYDDGTVANESDSIGAQDPNNPEADRGVSSNDRTHVLRLNGMYELPRLENSSAMMRMMVGGWRVAGIMSYLSGTPITVFSGVDRALTGCGNGCSGQRPDLNGDPTLPSDRSREEKIAQWFNTSPTVWTLPALGQYGNAPRTMNSLRGPSRFSTDMSLTKIFRLSSANNRRFELRIEAFNVFDQLLLNSPNGTRSDATFGQITSAAAPRVVQLAARFDF
jgi:hypothetical protein